MAKRFLSKADEHKCFLDVPGSVKTESVTRCALYVTLEANKAYLATLASLHCCRPNVIFTFQHYVEC
jgi:hypothetical protein